MFNLKNYILKQATNIKIVESSLGQVTVKADIIMRFLEDYKQYDKLIKRAIRVLNSVHIINFNYESKTVTLNYNYNDISEKKVVEWLKIVINVIIDNFDIIRKYMDTNEGDLIEIFEEILKDRLIEL